MGKYFGTDGVRGAYPHGINESIAYRIGFFLGGHGFGAPQRVLLGRDTRISGIALADALSQGVVDAGGTVLDLQVTSTPSVSFLVAKEHIPYGVMISASHNPYQDNGIKVFNGDGEKLSADIEARIEELLDAPQVPEGPRDGLRVNATALRDAYVDWLCSKASPNLKGLRVVADLANGSATSIAPALFQRLGLNAELMGNEPDGRNINRECGSTHIESLRQRFLQGNYDLGLCFDGDADRFMAIAPDGRIIDGDAQIFLSALSLTKAHHNPSNAVVITVMSNFGLRKALDQEGIGYEVVSVGDKYVQAALKKGNLPLGGEQSGHVIYLDDLNTGDGLLSAIKLMNLFVNEKDIFAKLNEFRVYPQVLKNLRLESKQQISAALANDATKAVIAEVEARLGTHGRLLVRPSGTEPLIRVMAEDLDERECEKAVDDVLAALEGAR